MPIMNGFEATLKLKDLMKENKLHQITIMGCKAFVTWEERK